MPEWNEIELFKKWIKKNQTKILGLKNTVTELKNFYRCPRADAQAKDTISKLINRSF